MDEKLHEILMDLNRGRIPVDKAFEQIKSAICEANAQPQLYEVRALGEALCDMEKYIPDESSALGEKFKIVVEKYNKVSEHFI